MPNASILRALAYHTRTKHHLHGYARGPGRLDWDTQPNPFRTFEGAPAVELPLGADRIAARYRDLYRSGAVPPAPVNLDSVGSLFELALGLSAWKQIQGSRWALRCNPSSGNLHPTEGYLCVPGVPEVPAGLYHYVSRDHRLERRSTLGPGSAGALAAVLPAGGFLVGLSSIHWREAWKYGERAFRYCQHDAGHAIAAVRYAAATLGWSAVLLDGLGDAEVSALLGLDREADFAAVEPADREHPDAMLLVVPRRSDGAEGIALSAAAEAFCASIGEAVKAVREGAWAGTPNALSSSHVDWSIIDDAAEATSKPATPMPPVSQGEDLPSLTATGDALTAAGDALTATGDAPTAAGDALTATGDALTAAGGALARDILRGRRSAVAFDGHTSIAAETFYSMLDHLLPRPGVPPWDAIPWAPHIHAVIFVHRVRGLTPGLYAFERSATVHDRFRAALTHPFDWERPAGCPPHLRLYCLDKSDLRSVAQIVSCHQEIAADGAFSLGMIADFGASIRDRGAWWYRRLFWEAGVLGHVLYLEAEAAKDSGGPVRATGIGCYFDDVFHDLCGLSGDEFQSLYHFTVGGPVEDTRLTTLPPYEHLAMEGRSAPTPAAPPAA